MKTKEWREREKKEKAYNAKSLVRLEHMSCRHEKEVERILTLLEKSLFDGKTGRVGLVSVL
jgi:hypothetical protein